VYSNGVFATKDNAGQSPSWAMITTIFGTVSGFVNTDRGNSDDCRPSVQLRHLFRFNTR